MDISLRYPSGEAFVFPVNPEEITIRRDKQFETVNLLSVGEVDVPQREKVREIAFSSFFPKVHDESYCMCGGNHPDPQEAMNRLTALMNSREPVQLIVSETAVNVLVTLSSHSSTFKGGEPGDVYFDVTFRTYREMRAKPAGKKGTNTRSDPKPVPKVYTVKSGDTLWAIAKLQLGDSGKWKSIYDRNKAVIGPNPSLIKPGQKLVMP
ncbi:LysM peptidoglycan-binding domain-containing protein [Cohnella sp. CFH 77786]|uniref:LysM peptidoglycan-binding domain-containing protein n=1 Tax=Cohnella sp. CFH 77786 TaxID=2662265 RepID=UPI001C60A74B|nr:LysM peptidoglycan-binding domain-containing protein [Cohnella sp. CFH 77786]MBW5447444.1 LysM peptidoglycan-binding domain-containing protein [Cohnella sp. CFH 77786]